MSPEDNLKAIAYCIQDPQIFNGITKNILTRLLRKNPNWFQKGTFLETPLQEPHPVIK